MASRSLAVDADDQLPGRFTAGGLVGKPRTICAVVAKCLVRHGLNTPHVMQTTAEFVGEVWCSGAFGCNPRLRPKASRWVWMQAFRPLLKRRIRSTVAGTPPFDVEVENYLHVREELSWHGSPKTWV